MKYYGLRQFSLTAAQLIKKFQKNATSSPKYIDKIPQGYFQKLKSFSSYIKTQENVKDNLPRNLRKVHISICKNYPAPHTLLTHDVI